MLPCGKAPMQSHNLLKARRDEMFADQLGIGGVLRVEHDAPFVPKGQQQPLGIKKHLRIVAQRATYLTTPGMPAHVENDVVIGNTTRFNETKFDHP